jgi:WD40 repeat protein
MTFSPDARRLAVGSDGKEAVTLFDTQTHEELLKLSADGSIFEEVQFSPDGRILGAKDDGGNLNLWRAPSWEEIAAAENTDNP